MSAPAKRRDGRRVVFASALGTTFEWYDFYLYGALAETIGRRFFAGLDPGSGFIFALLAFAAGFVVRPFGAIVFGRLGDMIGRKYTFLVTILLMGLSTFVVGLLPDYASIGVAAPIILVAVRLLQGLAVGGEYGGAATYVGEHAPRRRRGAYTGWVQTTATLGLLLSLAMTLGLREALGTAVFEDWGWRLCFLVSLVLLGTSVWIRLHLPESPAFMRIKREGRIAKAPLTEAFGYGANVRNVLLALFGLTAGQGVVWYGSQFYALLFLTQTLKLDGVSAGLLMGAALLLAMPCFWLAGALSDRIGRKPVIVGGLLFAVFGYFPVFHALAAAGNPQLVAASARTPVTLVADPRDCSFQFNPLGIVRFDSSCDVARQLLAGAAVDYRQGSAPGLAHIHVGASDLAVFDGKGLPDDAYAASLTRLHGQLEQALRAAGYPARADPARIDRVRIVLLLALLAAGVALVYGPLAAALIELFPTRIRYTSLSLPYHIGNGWFGGLLPTIAFALVAEHGSIYQGLWYPVAVAGLSAGVALLWLPETYQRDIYAHD